MSEPAQNASHDPSAMITALGFDAARVKAVILTPTSVVAVATDYPEPLDPPHPDSPESIQPLAAVQAGVPLQEV